MKIFHSRKQFLVFFMPGFLLGIVYVNFIARQYMAEPGIFSDFFLNQFQSVSIDAREYIWYLLRLRAVPFLALAGLSLTRAGKASAVLFLVWTGISAGILISAAVLNLGIKGSLLCLVGLFPQFLLYIPAYVVLLWYCYTVPQTHWNRQKTIFVSLAMSQTHWNRQKTIFVSLAMSVGILLEIYINPMIVKAFLSVL